MHVSLSDLLTCPRCGPDHGLILLPGQRAGRRVQTGTLGCPNCEVRYRIEGGVADLRVAVAAQAVEPAGEPVAAEEAAKAADGEDGGGDEGGLRLGALLGLAGVSGAVVLAGPASASGRALGRLVEAVEVIVLAGAGSGSGAPESGPGKVSTLRVGDRLPLRSGSVAAVALTGGRTGLLEEAARVVRPAGRLLLEPADEVAAARARELGLRAVLHEGETLVLTRGA